MKKRANQLRLASAFSTLICNVLYATGLLAQGLPDIIWSRTDHTKAVNSVSFSREGSFVASGSSDATIRIWQATNGDPKLTLTNQNIGVLRIAFAINGSLASWDSTNSLSVWELASGRIVREQSIPRVYSTAFSFQGDLFAAVGGYDFPSKETLYIWRVADGTLVTTFVPDQIATPAFSRNNRLVAAGLGLAEEYKMYVWQLSDGALVSAFTNYQSGISLYGAPVFSPDSAKIAAMTGPYGRTEIWDIVSGGLRGLIPEETGSPGQSVYVKLLVFTPDGRIAIMSDRDDKIRIWRVEEGQEIVRLALYDAETAGINALAMSPKGDLFAYGRQDGKVIVARVPVFITEARLSSGQIVLQWAGGSGSYQLQQRTNLATGIWENAGAPTTASGVTNNVSGGSLFFRVQSLPN